MTIRTGLWLDAEDVENIPTSTCDVCGEVGYADYYDADNDQWLCIDCDSEVE